MKVIILPIIVDSAYLPTTASESRNDPTKFNVQSVDLTKFEPVNISPGMSIIRYILLGSHCRQTTVQPKDQRKSRNFMPKLMKK